MGKVPLMPAVRQARVSFFVSPGVRCFSVHRLENILAGSILPLAQCVHGTAAHGYFPQYLSAVDRLNGMTVGRTLVVGLN